MKTNLLKIFTQYIELSCFFDAGYCPRVSHTLTLTGQSDVALRLCTGRRALPTDHLFIACSCRRE